MKTKVLLIIVAVILLVLISYAVKKQNTLIYVIIPAEEGSLSQEQFEPFMEYLSARLGREVKLMPVSDYTAVIEALKFGHADIARPGSVGYVLAKDKENIPIEVLAVAIKKATNSPSYKAILVTRADSDVHDLNGASLAYVDVGSASGYWAPATHILEEEIELGHIFFAGSHSAVIEAVKNGTVDVGAIADNRYNIALEEGVIAEGELRILWESAPIFNVPIVIQNSMDTQTKENLRQAFLDAPRDVVEHTGIGEIGFVSVSDSDYDQIRRMLEAKEHLER